MRSTDEELDRLVAEIQKRILLTIPDENRRADVAVDLCTALLRRFFSEKTHPLCPLCGG